MYLRLWSRHVVSRTASAQIDADSRSDAREGSQEDKEEGGRSPKCGPVSISLLFQLEPCAEVLDLVNHALHARSSMLSIDRNHSGCHFVAADTYFWSFGWVAKDRKQVPVSRIVPHQLVTGAHDEGIELATA